MTTKTVNYTARIGDKELSGSVEASGQTWNDGAAQQYAAAALRESMSFEEWAELDVESIEVEVSEPEPEVISETEEATVTYHPELSTTGENNKNAVCDECGEAFYAYIIPGREVYKCNSCL